jgi:hypothetical protein
VNSSQGPTAAGIKKKLCTTEDYGQTVQELKARTQKMGMM